MSLALHSPNARPANFFTPKQTSVLWLQSGVEKWRIGLVVAFGKAIFGGVLLSFGAMLSLTIGGGSPTLSTANPGIVKLLSASVFGIGLVMIVLTGAELVTSNMAIIKRRTPWYSYPANILVVTLGNLAGSLIVAALLGHASGIFEAEPYHSFVLSFADKKAVHPSWGQILSRGIGCNLLVCVAVFQATAAFDIVSKILAIELPVFAFVCLGYDHVVANMLFIPLALMLGAPPPLSVGYYVWKSMIPAFIGNVLGAAAFAIPITPPLRCMSLPLTSNVYVVSLFFLMKEESVAGFTHNELVRSADATQTSSRIDVENKV
ncbi:hypothetical protein OIV83_006176 [Microbotryomycetes sp. JL201]|nr:hypothetical protein OIV83_006176 [Microbotryomycetes sp. JL201]